LLDRMLRRQPRVFVSYRRSDSKNASARLVAVLRRLLGRGRVFFDVNEIAPGVDFRHEIAIQIDQSDILLLIVGPGWRDALGARGLRRLDVANDPIRVEIELAQNSGKRIVPVLVDGAEAAALEGLATPLDELEVLNAVRLRHESFDRDAAALLTRLRGPLAAGRFVAALAITALLTGGAWWIVWTPPTDLTATGQITEPGGHPVAEAHVVIARGGEKLGTAVTDQAGNFSIPISVPSPRSGVEVSVSVAGRQCLRSEDYVASDEIDVILFDCLAP